jgi:hypothetical protein
MPEQMDLLAYAGYATPACNAVRRRNAPPVPDSDGLFDAAGVGEICGRRQCSVHVKSELTILITGSKHRDRRTPIASLPAPFVLTAAQPGRWHPVAILSACTRANGGKAYDVDPEKVILISKPGRYGQNLDELKVAQVVGADGLRPFLSRPGNHHLRYSEDGTLIVQRPLNHRNIPAGYIPIIEGTKAASGNPTWAFLQVLCLGSLQPKMSYEVRRALRALEDVGLVDIEPGPRGGMATATVTWTARAMMPPQLSLYDHDALQAIAEGRL